MKASTTRSLLITFAVLCLLPSALAGTCSCRCQNGQELDYTVDDCNSCNDKCSNACLYGGSYSCSSGSLVGGLVYLGITVVIACIFVAYIRHRRIHMGLPVDNGTMCAHWCGCFCCSVFYCCFYFCTETTLNRPPQTQQVVVYTTPAVQQQPGGYPAGGYPAGGYPGAAYPSPYSGNSGPEGGAFPQGGKQAAPMPSAFPSTSSAQMVAMPAQPVAYQGYVNGTSSYPPGVVMATVVAPGGPAPPYQAYAAPPAGAPPPAYSGYGETSQSPPPPNYGQMNEGAPPPPVYVAPHVQPSTVQPGVERAQFGAAQPPEV